MLASNPSPLHIILRAHRKHVCPVDRGLFCSPSPPYFHSYYISIRLPQAFLREAHSSRPIPSDFPLFPLALSVYLFTGDAENTTAVRLYLTRPDSVDPVPLPVGEGQPFAILLVGRRYRLSNSTVCVDADLLSFWEYCSSVNF